jgi:predicted nucleotidyltransferase
MATARPGVVAALFGKTRSHVLALLFGQPDRSFYLREIVARVGSGMSQVQKELEQLTRAGLVLREQRANQVHFRANPAAPIYAELVALVTKTFGVADVLRELLARFRDRIRLAFIYGSIAKGSAHAASDVDVLVVGELAPSALSLPLSEAERRLGRRVSVITYSTAEFAARVREEQHFVAAVLDGPKIYLVGDDAALDELRHEQPRKSRARKAPRR